jgi:hypothetical protein
MEWKDMLQELINLVQQAAPKLWGIAVKQIYVQAIQSAIVAISCVIPFGACMKWLLWARSNMGKEIFNGAYTVDEEHVMWPIFFMLIIFCIFVAFVIASISKVINPEYYAIELLIDYVK